MRAAASVTGRMAVWLVILGVGGALLAAVLLPRIGGATPYAVLSSSMEPDLSPGTLVVVRPSASDDIAVGDVITYQLESGQAPVVTHRVVGIRTDLRGETSFLTQGDANTAVDAEPVRPVQVRGELWYAVPYLGRVHTLLSGAPHRLLVWGAAAALIGYAAVMFSGAARERRTRAAAGTHRRSHVGAGHG